VQFRVPLTGLAALVCLSCLPGCSKTDAGDGAAATPRASVSVTVGRDPSDLAVVRDGVLVVNHSDDSLVRIDPVRGTVEGRPLRVGDAPISIAVAGRTAWIGHRRTPDLVGVDLDTGRRVSGRIRIGRPGDDYSQDGIAVAYANGALWAVNRNLPTLWRIDVRSHRATAVAEVGARPYALLVDAGVVWVANAGDGTVTRFDVETSRTIGDPVRVGRGPVALAASRGAVWVANYDAGTVSKVDARSGRVLGGPIDVGGRPADLVVAGASLWVADSAGGVVKPIDLASHAVGPSVAVGQRPLSLATGANTVWVANALDGTVTRIDLPRKEMR
jgi:serine/threonine-protein kinase